MSVTGRLEEVHSTYSHTSLCVFCAISSRTTIATTSLLRFLLIDRNRSHLDGKHFVIHLEGQIHQCFVIGLGKEDSSREKIEGGKNKDARCQSDSRWNRSHTREKRGLETGDWP